MARIKFMNTEIDNLTMQEALQEIERLIDKKQNAYVVTPNIDHIVQLEQGGKLCEVYANADLILADGKPLLWIAKWFGTPIKEKISGSDLFPLLCEMAAEKKYPMFFLGAAEGVARKAAENLMQRYPGLHVAGTYSPPLGFESDAKEMQKIEKMIKEANPSILVVGLGCPKQEIFIYENRNKLKIPVSLGLGASLDFEAGSIKRAPKWMSEHGLEWFFRITQDPKRMMKRYFIDDRKIFGLVWKYRIKDIKMDAFQNIGLKEYFKRYGCKYGIQRGIFSANPIHIVTNYDNKKALYYAKVQKMIHKKYWKFAGINPDGLSFGDYQNQDTVWVYWKQGLEHAPEIVKVCIDSIIKFSSKKVIIITDKNISEYVIFPDYIMKKLKSGHMSIAAFSDLLRFSLLEHYGGTWIDATVYLTQKIPDYMLEEELFAFQDSFGPIPNAALMSIWFLHSSAGSNIIRMIRNISYAYWKNENRVMEYLFSNIVFTMAVRQSEQAYNKIPYVNSEYCNLMLKSLGKPYEEKKFRHITGLSSVHKLTYKLHEQVHENNDNIYHYLLRKNSS